MDEQGATEAEQQGLDARRVLAEHRRHEQGTFELGVFLQGIE